MINYKCTVTYDGTKYNGWQRLQSNKDKTIQGKIEGVISRILESEIEILGSGRTDGGVHALMQVFNFKCEKKLDDNFLKELNHYLPEDIKVLTCQMVDDRFHARHNAKNKVYLYRIDNSTFGNPFERRYSYYIEKKLDVELMRQCAQIFIGEHDFTSFSKNSGKKKSTVKKLKEIRIVENSNGIIEIFYEGDGFLYNMVRMLTGAIIQVSLGKSTLIEIENLLKNKTREEHRFVVPPQGLFLARVDY